MSNHHTETPQTDPTDKCIEDNTFTDLPSTPPFHLLLDYATVNSAKNQQIIRAERMTFHVVGCAGDPSNPSVGLAVGNGMASQIANPEVGFTEVPAFFYHLGDIAYKHGSSDTASTSSSPDLSTLWNTQFYSQYTNYQYPANGSSPSVPAPIFAIAGNHDAKSSSNNAKSEIGHFLQNFCGTQGTLSPDNQTGDGRTEMFQPYPYWILETPLAYIIGLYTNDTNGGILDNPHVNHDPTTGPQYLWFVSQLEWVKQQNSAGGTYKAVLVTLHYPPFNGATNFAQRGDPTLGPTPGAKHAIPIGALLQQAYITAGQIPDAVFSAHAHLYQRLTYTYNDPATNLPTQQVPYLIAGAGGHTPLENLWKPCSKQNQPHIQSLPMNIFTQNPSIIPPGLTLPGSDTVFLEAAFDSTTNPDVLPYGFLRVTITAATSESHPTLACAYCTMQYKNGVITDSPVVVDAFVLDLETHLLNS